jgi:hypothetical protein
MLGVMLLGYNADAVFGKTTADIVDHAAWLISVKKMRCG